VCMYEGMGFRVSACEVIVFTKSRSIERGSVLCIRMFVSGVWWLCVWCML
jgi:hypothetical protein